MPNRNYQRGVRYERKTQDSLDMPSVRTAGSHGIFDVIAYSSELVRFIQVKATKKKIRISLYKKDIDEIRSAEVPENSTKELWVYGHGKLEKIWVI